MIRDVVLKTKTKNKTKNKCVTYVQSDHPTVLDQDRTLQETVEKKEKKGRNSMCDQCLGRRLSGSTPTCLYDF